MSLVREEPREDHVALPVLIVDEVALAVIRRSAYIGYVERTDARVEGPHVEPTRSTTYVVAGMIGEPATARGVPCFVRGLRGCYSLRLSARSKALGAEAERVFVVKRPAHGNGYAPRTGVVDHGPLGVLLGDVGQQVQGVRGR